MKILISLGKEYYRGLTQKYSKQYEAASHIVWVTSDKKYAERYADGKALITYELKLGRAFNFGFRTLDVSVKLNEVVSRVRRGLVAASKTNAINMYTAIELNDRLNSIALTDKFKKVWEWYQTEPILSEILLACGYSHIEAKEGTDDNIDTIGILDKTIIKSVKEL